MPRPYRLSPEVRARRADPEVRAKMSAARKAAWADPEMRAKMSAAIQAAFADPEKNPLAGLTPDQRRIYNKLRAHGLGRIEALAEARREVRPSSREVA